jgi:hypothetical protein
MITRVHVRAHTLKVNIYRNTQQCPPLKRDITFPTRHPLAKDPITHAHTRPSVEWAVCVSLKQEVNFLFSIRACAWSAH